ncbi:MT-A70 family protein [Perkinsela sp. CCAP 1560/4]|nr:MT-A70 family protein [Perkinsela sp. CCAP 1560/4]|eukprot:KNH05194.1 MT-A70 family protein [Perkinsela sp. CCAP 1560/4]
MAPSFNDGKCPILGQTKSPNLFFLSKLEMKNAHAWSELLECRRINQRNHQLTTTAMTRESQVHESRPWFDGLPPITGEDGIEGPLEDADIDEQLADSIEHPLRSCAISADVRTFDFLALSKIVPNFDAIIIDPPWDVGRSGFGPTAQGRVRFRRNTVSAQNSCSSPQYALNYHQLRDSEIGSIPMEAIQQDGLIFMWIVNNRLQKGINIMCHQWKYRFVTIIDWIKTHR